MASFALCGVAYKPRVKVTGFIRTRRQEKNGERKYFQDIVGETIDFAPSIMESAFGSGFAGQHKAKSVNSLRILGKVTHIYEFTDRQTNAFKSAVLTMRTIRNGRVYTPKLVVFNRAMLEESGAAVGSRIAVVGEVYEKLRSTNGGKPQHTETLVANEIQLLDD